MRTLKQRNKGYTLIEVMIVVGIIGLLLTLAIPNFINARKRAQATTCIENLKLLYEGGQLYRLETGSAVTAVDAQVLYTQGYTEEALSCPKGGAYAAWNIDSHPTCAIGTNDSLQEWDDHIYP